MTKIPSTRQPPMIRVPRKTVTQLFTAGARLADLAEDLLEREGLYRRDFLKSLEEAEADVKAGRVSTVTSLTDLRDRRS